MWKLSQSSHSSVPVRLDILTAGFPGAPTELRIRSLSTLRDYDRSTWRSVPTSFFTDKVVRAQQTKKSALIRKLSVAEMALK